LKKERRRASVESMNLEGMGVKTITTTLPPNEQHGIFLKPELKDGVRVQLVASFGGQKCSNRAALEIAKEER